MLRFGFTLSILVLAGAQASHAAPVVALGASNTAGRGRGATADGVPKSQAFPAQLEALLSGQGCKVKVLNAGIAGDTTGGMLRRLPGLLGMDTKVVVLQPGGNDARRGEEASIAANVEAMRQIIAKHGAKVVIMGNLGRFARQGSRLPDGQHFNVEGHAAFAASVASAVRAAACG